MGEVDQYFFNKLDFFVIFIVNQGNGMMKIIEAFGDSSKLCSTSFVQEVGCNGTKIKLQYLIEFAEKLGAAFEYIIN